MADQLDRQIKSYIRKLRKIDQIEVPRANASALNKVGGLSRTRTVKGVSKQTRVPAKEVRKRTYFSRANAKKQRALLKVYSKPVPASRLLTKGQIANKLGTGTNKKGVRAKGYMWRGAFIQKGNNGNVHVFQRKGSARLPIERVDIDINKPVQRITPVVVRRVMKSDYRRLLLHDLDFRLKKYQVR